jgi:ubiquinone/menaquinone biosynthesis C-methylase UbiE
MAHKSTIDAYNKIAEEFHQRNAVSIYSKEYEIFESLVGKGSKIIDIGCGTGRDAEELIRRGFDYTGIDASKGMLKVARNRVKGGKFEIGDFYKLDFEDDTFDGFWAAASLFHVPKKDIDKVVLEIKRIIKKDGIGFISVKQKRTIDEGIIKETRGGGIKRYFSFYVKNELKDILERNGFSVLNITKMQDDTRNQAIWICYFVKKIKKYLNNHGKLQQIS